jgi:hypothetical protein
MPVTADEAGPLLSFAGADITALLYERWLAEW